MLQLLRNFLSRPLVLLAALAVFGAPVAYAIQPVVNPVWIGHVKSAPDAATPVLSSCGTSPAIAAGSTDMVGRIVTGSAATTCTITFAKSYTQAPVCQISAEIATQPTWTVSATAITFATDTASTAYHYHCVGIGSDS